VVGVTWYEANAYCKWLLVNWDHLEEGQQGLPKPKEIRLPTETEWILAAGGEAQNRFAFGELKDVKDLPRHANTSESGIQRTTPVWMYPGGATPEGLMDMSGNVFEWQANNRSTSSRALRGGSWYLSGVDARVSGRYFLNPDSGYDDVGFRLVVFALPN
jgi:formylglycine-generating enzyme required for sulfatase activity